MATDPRLLRKNRDCQRQHHDSFLTEDCWLRMLVFKGKMVGILRKGMLFSSYVDRVYAGVEATFAWILLAFMLS